jgi:hypothetical protein
MTTMMMTKASTARDASDWVKESARAHHFRLAMSAWRDTPWAGARGA